MGWRDKVTPAAPQQEGSGWRSKVTAVGDRNLALYNAQRAASGAIESIGQTADMANPAAWLGRQVVQTIMAPQAPPVSTARDMRTVAETVGLPTQDDLQPRSDVERYTGRASEFLGASAPFGPSGGVRNAAKTLGWSALSGLTYQGAQDLTGNDLIAAGVSLATPFAGSAALRQMTASAPQKARDLVLRAVRRDPGAETPTALRTERDRLVRSNSGETAEMVFETGGENLRGLARAAANVAGPTKQIARDALTTRSRGTEKQQIQSAVTGGARRILDTLTTTLRTNPNDYQSAVTTVDRQMRSAAGPLYKAAFSRQVPSAVLRPLFETGATRSILGDALRLASTSRNANAVRAELEKLMQNGLPASGRSPVGVRTVDYIKRAIDDQVQVALRQGNNQLARELLSIQNGQGTRQGIIRLTDRFAPQYRAARDAWRAGADLKDAMVQGENVLKEGVDDLNLLMGNLTQGERDAYLLGASRAIADTILKSDNGTRAISQILNSPLVKQRLMAAFPRTANNRRDAYLRFMTRLQREARMLDSERSILGGSRTTPLAEEIADNTGQAGIVAGMRDEAQRGIASGGFSGMVNRLAARIFERLTQPGLYDERINSEVGRILYSTARGKSGDSVFDELTAALRQRQSRRRPALTAAVPGVIAAQEGQ